MIADDSQTPPADHPAEIAGYRIERVLGAGASGRVYLAREQHPPRAVALKTLLQLTDAQQRRFARETEVLAGLEHPQIARLYDAGDTTLGGTSVAWMAMAYIEGETLGEWAQRAKPTPREALGLIAALARAVHFAHTRGVIHRDLKPANILVRTRTESTARGAAPEPVIVDFGVAHVVQGQSDSTVMTQAGQVLGTLPYMSFEQLTGEQVDARSDVYALGAIAYELIAGQLPYPGLSGSTLMGALETLQRGKPKRLSALVPEARGDVETIIDTAMAREAHRRYGSAAELAADIERWLDRRPIEARKPTLAYTAGLFVRRNKAVTAAACVAVAALVTATAVSLGLAASERAARMEAQMRLAERSQISGFLQDILSASDPDLAQGRDITVREVLDGARLRLEADAAMPASVRANLMATLASSLSRIGQPDTALELAQGAEESAQGQDVLTRSVALEALGEVRNVRGEHDEAYEAFAQALELRRQSNSAATADVFALRASQASVQIEQGDIDAAYAAVEGLSAEANEVLGANHPVSLNILQDFASVTRLTGDYAGAIALAKDVVERRTAVLGPTHPDTLHSRNGLATHLSRNGDHAQAEAMLRDVLQDRISVLGEEHLDVWRTQANLAVVLADQGKHEESIALLRPLPEKYASWLGPNHRYTLLVMNNVAAGERDVGNLAAGEAMLRAVIERVGSQPGSQHSDLYLPKTNLGQNLLSQGRTQEGEAVLAEAAESARLGLPEDHTLIYIIEAEYGKGQLANGRHAAAAQTLTSAIENMRRKLPVDHPRIVSAEGRLAEAQTVVTAAE